jgi:hypothetical protein
MTYWLSRPNYCAWGVDLRHYCGVTAVTVIMFSQWPVTTKWTSSLRNRTMGMRSIYSLWIEANSMNRHNNLIRIDGLNRRPDWIALAVSQCGKVDPLRWWRLYSLCPVSVDARILLMKPHNRLDLWRPMLSCYFFSGWQILLNKPHHMLDHFTALISFYFPDSMTALNWRWQMVVSVTYR